jgi:sarcosine oxidase subunit beta
LNPFHTTEAFAHAAKRLGVEFMTYTTVTGITTENGRVTGVQTDKGYISTPIVVNAAGGYSKIIGQMAGVEVPVYAQRHQILVTEAVEPLQGPMYMGFALNIYCQQSPHGSFIMGRGDDNEPTDLRITSSWQFMEEMAKTCCELLPLLSKLRIVRQWAGLYTMTADAHPIYGGVKELEGFYLACGFSGHGFMLGPAAGELLTRLVTGKPDPEDDETLSYISPSRKYEGQELLK